MKTIGEILAWLEAQRLHNKMEVQSISFLKLKEWSFYSQQAILKHNTGKFFSIEGLKIATNFGTKPNYFQPIINQPEIGILGFIVQHRSNELYFLAQAKNEPGNINGHQIAPTLQATESNYQRVHKGRASVFLELFQDKTKYCILYDQLQSEQGSRFLKKRNRNIVIRIPDKMDLEHDDSFCWLTYSQLFALMQKDNVVNADTRSVLSCFPHHLIKPEKIADNPHQQDISISFKHREHNCLHSIKEIQEKLTRLRAKYYNEIEIVPLSEMADWKITGDEIRHENNGDFKIIAIDVHAKDREVEHWDQPIVTSIKPGILCFFCKKINEILHFLTQAIVEPGTYDILELTTTIQSTEKQLKTQERLSFFCRKYYQAASEQIWYSSVQSEEGGRFFQDQNQYSLIYFEDEQWDIPDNYLWLTLGQMKFFLQYNGFLSSEARSFIAQLNCPAFSEHSYEL